MPLYEYQCEACHHRFEKIQKFSDPLEDTCPKCSGKVRKLLSSPAIQFKGSGWYITDYAKKSSTDASKGGTAKGDSASTDTKADGKTSTEGKASTEGKTSTESKTSSESKTSGDGSAKKD